MSPSYDGTARRASSYYARLSNPAWGGRRYPPINTIPPALERRIRDRWGEYGLGIDYLTEEQRELLTLERLSKILPEV